MRALILVAVLMACGPLLPPSPPEPSQARQECETACANLERLGCPEAEPTEDGVSCVELCVEVESAGTVSLNAECVSNIARCEDIEAC